MAGKGKRAVWVRHDCVAQAIVGTYACSAHSSLLNIGFPEREAGDDLLDGRMRPMPADAPAAPAQIKAGPACCAACFRAAPFAR